MEELHRVADAGPTEDPTALFRDLGAQAGARVEADRALKENLLQYLASGAVVGFGFEAPRRLQDSAIAIPNGAWSGFVGWSQSQLEHQGIRFLEVRVMPAHWEEQLKRRWHDQFAPAPAVKTRGPEGTARQIAEAYTALKEAGQIDFEASMQALYPRVRHWLMAHYPQAGFSDSKPHDETLRKTISPLFAGDCGKGRQ
ncbi:hypothetical protein AAFN88_16880 [Pelagibius sp. CAU 1746]|uniref:hypothetical protein n=1 Tax=Pelagibius sp. CAU 1746 TaxID=3140370 RepID=UPI00325B5AA2